jgi:hypothetical protein
MGFNSGLKGLIKRQNMKVYCRVEVELHLFLVMALSVGEWLASRQGSFISLVRFSGTQSIGEWTSEPLWMLWRGSNPLKRARYQPPVRTRICPTQFYAFRYCIAVNRYSSSMVCSVVS